VVAILLWFKFGLLVNYLLKILFLVHRVVVQGPGPGPRYGHVMALVGQRFLLTIGGNDGRKLFMRLSHLGYSYIKLVPAN
jgi:hypothetical protein